MIKVEVKGCESFVDAAKYQAYVAKALDAFDVLKNENGAGNDFLGWKKLPRQITEREIHNYEAIRDKWMKKGIDLVIAIGIGGSYLGAKCVIEALSHSFAKQLKRKDAPEVVFAGNNLSEEYLAELMDLAAVAFRVVKQFIEARYGKGEAADRIVAITDAQKGALKTLATQESYESFVVPDNVGGRFSVLTPVGLLPICVAGFDIKALVEGAQDAAKGLEIKSDKNPAIIYAAMRNCLFKEVGKSTEILVNYNPKLTYVAEWWKQLYGESEGKEGTGIFPASVNNTADLHSMGQFIQEGSRVMFETVLHVDNAQRSIVIESDLQNLDQLNYLAGKHVEHCNHMAELGTQLAHIDGGVPQMSINLEKIDAFNLGSLLYFFEFACGISAYILGVNPFNQPGVEAYKKNMFALLEKPGYEQATKAIKERL